MIFNNYMWRGRMPLQIAVGILLIVLVFEGGASAAINEMEFSFNPENYPEIPKEFFFGVENPFFLEAHDDRWNAMDVIWSSSDENIAFVSPKTGTGTTLNWLRSGTVKVSAISENGEEPYIGKVAFDLNGDNDGDGLWNLWENYGIDVNSDGIIDLDLKALGADPNRKDIFVEIDYMIGHNPNDAALKDVEMAFAAKGIALHYFIDEATPEIERINFTDQLLGVADDFNDLKRGNPPNTCGIGPNGGHFGTLDDRTSSNCGNIIAAKQLVYRYAIFGHNHDHPPGSSGIAEIGGNDFMVTLGGWSPDYIGSVGGQQAVEAGTFMHELGHTLGLGHGGRTPSGEPDGINCKPNYLSIMSYSLQFPNYDPTRPLDYSSDILPDLDEYHLYENIGIDGPLGRNTVYGINGVPQVVSAEGAIDWNGDDDSTDNDVMADVSRIDSAGCGDDNFDGIQDGMTPLTGFNDWQNLHYSFRDSPNYVDGVDIIAPEEITAEQALTMARSIDYDEDGFSNADDNCPAIFNPDQDDTNLDGIGNACDDNPHPPPPDNLDTTPPTTNIELSGTLGINNWYTSNVQVTLTATDNEGGSGINKTEYSFDNAAWIEYNAEFSIATESTTTLYYRSTDNAGNIEPTKNQTIKIDKTSPLIESITLYPANTTAGATINIRVSTSDNIGVVEVTADGTALTNSSGVWQGSITAPSSLGNYMVLIKARDAAGNEAESSPSYRVVLRQGGASVSVSPMSNNVISGTSLVLNIKIKNTQNIDDTFKVHINVSDLPLSSQANLAWFNWTQKVLDVKAGNEALVPIMITVPAGVSGTKAFRAKANSAVLTSYAYGTGYLKIT